MSFCEAFVIGQTDRKFISCRLSTHATGVIQEGDEALNTPRRSFIVAIDQHAADERIRVEGLVQRMAEQIRNCGRLSTKSLETSLVVRLAPAEQAFFREAPSAFELLARWGLSCTPDAEISSQGMHRVTITAVPVILATRLRNDRSELERAFHEYISDLIDSAACQTTIDGFLRDYNLHQKDSNNIMRWCPSRFLHLMKSNACRGQSC